MTAEIRPRNDWEGIDLGFVMARQWFKPLLLLWCTTAAPVTLLATLLFYDQLWLLLLVIWWCKPLYEKPLLYFLSRALFAELEPPHAVVRRLPRILGLSALGELGIRRLSLNRAFNAPVTLLEGLRGKVRAQRLRVLHHRVRGSVWLTIICLHFETLLYISVLLFLLMLIPEEMDIAALLDNEEYKSYFQWTMVITYVAATAVVAPFYVAAGFALYLTKRAAIEGWDIELQFKRIRNALTQNKSHKPSWGALAGLIGAAVLTVCLGATPATAAENAAAVSAEEERVRTVIDAVMARAVFGKEQTRTYWRYKGKPARRTDRRLNLPTRGLARFIEGMLWIAAAVLLAMAAVKLAPYLGWFKGSAPKKPSAGPPSELFGLDLRSDSLPADVPAAVLRLLAENEQRRAVALLYRATLIRLMTGHRLQIAPSSTEKECMRLVADHRPPAEARFFRRLTSLWLGLAYAHRLPEQGAVPALCDEWRRFYAPAVHE